MDIQTVIVQGFSILVLLFSVVIHEVSHGAVALMFGDRTAKDMGRLTLNPIKHLDLFGSIILPTLLVVLNAGIIFGWAKPVPYNPFYFKNPRLHSALVGLAGPFSNIALAGIFAGGLRMLHAYDLLGLFNGFIGAMFLLVILINVVLAVFNLVPIPPLDGSKLLFALISDKYMGVKMFLERYGILLFLFFILAIGRVVGPIAFTTLRFLVGGDALRAIAQTAGLPL